MSVSAGGMGVGLGHARVPILALYQPRFPTWTTQLAYASPVWGTFQGRPCRTTDGSRPAPREWQGRFRAGGCMHSRTQHAPVPAKPGRGAEGRGPRSAVKTAARSCSPGGAGPQRRPRREGLPAKRRGSGHRRREPRPPARGATPPSRLCKQLFGPAREWPSRGAAMEAGRAPGEPPRGVGRRPRETRPRSPPLPRLRPPSPGPGPTRGGEEVPVISNSR